MIFLGKSYNIRFLAIYKFFDICFVSSIKAENVHCNKSRILDIFYGLFFYIDYNNLKDESSKQSSPIVIYFPEILYEIFTLKPYSG